MEISFTESQCALRYLPDFTFTSNKRPKLFQAVRPFCKFSRVNTTQVLKWQPWAENLMRGVGALPSGGHSKNGD